jgi:putative addiction module component (TIGR02574 family)
MNLLFYYCHKIWKAIWIQKIIKDALNLSPVERLFIIETLPKSLSEPDKNIEKYWKEEVEDRYEAYLSGKMKIIPYEKN